MNTDEKLAVIRDLFIHAYEADDKKHINQLIDALTETEIEELHTISTQSEVHSEEDQLDENYQKIKSRFYKKAKSELLNIAMTTGISIVLFHGVGLNIIALGCLISILKNPDGFCEVVENCMRAMALQCQKLRLNRLANLFTNQAKKWSEVSNTFRWISKGYKQLESVFNFINLNPSEVTRDEELIALKAKQRVFKLKNNERYKSLSDNVKNIRDAVLNKEPLPTKNSQTDLDSVENIILESVELLTKNSQVNIDSIKESILTSKSLLTKNSQVNLDSIKNSSLLTKNSQVNIDSIKNSSLLTKNSQVNIDSIKNSVLDPKDLVPQNLYTDDNSKKNEVYKKYKDLKSLIISNQKKNHPVSKLETKSKGGVKADDNVEVIKAKVSQLMEEIEGYKEKIDKINAKTTKEGRKNPLTLTSPLISM